jgi:hypothetical protein
MPKTSGSKVDIGNTLGRRMSGEQRVILVETVEIAVAQSTEAPQCDIKRTGGMAFGKYESIVGSHELVVNQHHCIDTREIAAKMASASTIVHPDQALARLLECGFRQGHN